MKIILALMAALLLAGCQTQPNLIKQKLVAVEVPYQLTSQCKVVKIPDRTSYTNRDVANLLIELKTMNVKCVNTIKAIEDFLKEVKVVAENQ